MVIVAGVGPVLDKFRDVSAEITACDRVSLLWHDALLALSFGDDEGELPILVTAQPNHGHRTGFQAELHRYPMAALPMVQA